MTTLRVALAQLDLVVGDLAGNVDRMTTALAEADAMGADLALYPELAISSYPPEDLVLKQRFVADNRAALHDFAARTGDVAAVVGFVDADERGLHNAAAVCAGGEVRGVYRKRLLPNYAVFDEERYFEPGEGPPSLFEVAGVPVGVAICEDAWEEHGPVPAMVDAGAGLVVIINGSPYHDGKVERREAVVGGLAARVDTPVAYLNLVGGQDELVFDGSSVVFERTGTVTARAGAFVEEVRVVDIPTVDRPRTGEVVAVTERRVDERASLSVQPPERLDRLEEIWQALVLGTRDYVVKNGFSDIVVGLSGGVDSSIVVTIAVDALGADHVHGVLMPSRYSSDHSVDDARRLSE
ncbi:MAG: nitrilase-related carbon-nitrogen hydrolase, partial [Actinomycetota bacterium]